jgi:hypothetical protein
MVERYVRHPYTLYNASTEDSSWQMCNVCSMHRQMVICINTELKTQVKTMIKDKISRIFPENGK